MSQEPEVIRQEMDDTRNALTDKISLLEQRVVDTVHEASAGVKDTVAAVKEAVQGTVQTVKDSVGETVDSVKETFNVRRQVECRPWTIMAGSVGLGFLAGYILNAPQSAAPPPTKPTAPRSPRQAGNGSHRERFAEPSSSVKERQAPAQEAVSGVLDHLTRTFENEISQLKGLAIGTLAGIVRDLVVTAVPQMMRNPVNEFFNDFTTKLGGQAIPGRIISEDWRGASDEHAQDASTSASTHNPRQSAFPTKSGSPGTQD